VTEKEDQMYAKLDFTLADIHNATESKNTIFSSEKESLMAKWRNPSLSIHGVEGAFYNPGAKTVIPAKISGKFSIRSVPNQEPATIEALVRNHVKNVFESLKSKNSIHLECLSAGKSWVADVNHWNYGIFSILKFYIQVAAAKAVETVFKVQPDYTREGGSIPVTLTFQEALQKNVLLLPMGRADDGAHSVNEKIDRVNYIDGIKLLGCYLHEIAKIAE
jgi:Cys-Gly metallodipeptidase DUG1